MSTPDYAGLIERLDKRADTMNGTAVGASDGSTYTLGYYDQFAARDDKEAATALRALLERNKELELMLRSANSMQQKTSTSMTDWVRRAEAAEAKLAEAMKVIGQIDNALNDQFAAGIEEREGGSARRQERLMKSGEELRRAARKFLKENGNGE